MLTLEEYKKVLGEKLLKELSEEQIVKLRDQQEQLAEIIFNMWLEDRKKKL